MRLTGDHQKNVFRKYFQTVFRFFLKVFGVEKWVLVSPIEENGFRKGKPSSIVQRKMFVFEKGKN